MEGALGIRNCNGQARTQSVKSPAVARNWLKKTSWPKAVTGCVDPTRRENVILGCRPLSAAQGGCGPIGRQDLVSPPRVSPSNRRKTTHPPIRTTPSNSRQAFQPPPSGSSRLESFRIRCQRQNRCAMASEATIRRWIEGSLFLKNPSRTLVCTLAMDAMKPRRSAPLEVDRPVHFPPSS